MAVKLDIGLGIKRFGSYGYKIIKHLDILPHVYCLDAAIIFENDEYFKMKSADRNGYKLDDFLV